jgi:hypothetical protein
LRLALIEEEARTVDARLLPLFEKEREMGDGSQRVINQLMEISQPEQISSEASKEQPAAVAGLLAQKNHPK